MGFYVLCALIGGAIGFLSALLGVGGGVIAVPAMIYLLGMQDKEAMATSLAVIVPVSLAAMVQHFREGQGNLRVGLLLALAGMVFTFVGFWVHGRVDAIWLRRAFAILLIIVGLRMFFGPQPQKQPEGTTPAATSPTSRA
jgi:uncharacterized membrane protein YfcA